MRAIRFLVLLIVLVVVFIATPTYELRPFVSLLPPDFMADSTFLVWFRQWVADDLARSSLVLTSWAALTFGLLAVPWPFHPAVLSKKTSAGSLITERRRFRWWGGLLLLLLAVSAGVGMQLLLVQVGEEPLVHLLWVSSVLLLFWGSALLTPRLVSVSTAAVGENVTYGPVAAARVSRRRFTDSWPTLLVVLVLGLILYGWQLITTPTQVDETTAQFGLHALRITTGEQTNLFAPIPEASPGETQLFGAAAASTGLFYWLTGDLLWSTRLIGLWAAISCAFATWLIGVELFARQPTARDLALAIEDYGQSPAMIATWLVLFNVAIIYFSRRAVLLEATAWGLMGCWALLYGFRRQDRLALTAAGALTGFSYLLHGSAYTFLLTALLWWLGFAASQLGLLPHLAPKAHDRRLHFGDFLLWLLAVFAVLAPVLAVRSQEFMAWLTQLPTSVEDGLMGLLSNLAPPVASYPAPVFHYILLPFLPLALGLLLFNLDRRQGWMLTTFLVSTLSSAILVQRQSLRWEFMVPLVPAIALALAFTFDRLRVSLIRVGGRWTQQFVGFGLLGLLLWVASAALITYGTFAFRQTGSVQAIGDALRALPAAQPVVVYLPDGESSADLRSAVAASTNPVLRFLTNDRIVQPDQPIHFVATLPAHLLPGTTVILLPDESSALSTLTTDYPAGTVQIRRDVQANPLVVLFTLGQE